jgi:tryptophan 2,3-dioxygenase
MQSGQFRSIEILGGLMPHDAMPLSERDRQELLRRAGGPNLYEALCACLRAHGFDAPDGDATGLRERRIASLAQLYRDHATAERAILHHVCELLLDHDEAIARWRFHHTQMAAREIGSRHGTGGSPGVAYLESTIPLRFFPELWDVRSAL